MPAAGYVTFTVKAKVSEDIYDAEDLNNTAIIHYGNGKSSKSDDPATADIGDPTQVHVNFNPNPSIALEKTGTLNDGGDGVQAGDTITYTFKVTNTGNVPLTNVTVEDDKVTVKGGPIAKLEPGQSDSTTFTATYTLTNDDVRAGKVENQATAIGKDKDGNDVTDQSDDPKDSTNTDPDGDGNPDDPTVTKFDTHPPVANDDSANGELGEPASVNITGNDSDPDRDLDPKTVSFDPDSVNGNGEDTDGDIDRVTVPGEGVWTVDENGKAVFTPEDGFTGDPTPIKYTVKDKAGNESNKAAIKIDYPQHPPVAKDDSSKGAVGKPVTLDAVNNDSDPDNDLNASSVNFDPTSVPNGNGEDTDGDGDIDRVTVPGEGVWSADENGKVTFTPEKDFTGDPTPIKYTVKDKNGNESNKATISVDYDQKPSIELEKIATLNDGGDGVQAGDTITYKFVVKNTGNVPLSNITIDDPKVEVTGGPIDLDVGQSDYESFSATYTITQEDVDAGKVENQATATGKDPSGNDVSDKSDDPQNPANEDLKS